MALNDARLTVVYTHHTILLWIEYIASNHNNDRLQHQRTLTVLVYVYTVEHWRQLGEEVVFTYANTL